LFTALFGSLTAVVIDSAHAAQGSGDPTFARDIAPIIFEHCSSCHHNRGSGPFSLMTYDDVAKRARQSGRVVDSGFMPPWLAALGMASSSTLVMLNATRLLKAED